MPRLKIGIIGGGNMGEALIKGLHQLHSVIVAEANKERAVYLKKKYKVNIAEISDVIALSKVVVLAVKPQDMQVLFSHVRPDYLKDNKLFISIAAGLTTKFFENALKNALNPKPRVVRSMPNMPALIGQGITGLCAGRYATSADIKTAQDILRTIGQTIVVKESMIDAVTAVSGSGPAYLFLFVEQWMAAAKKLGFKETEAKQLVYKTLLGSAHLLEQSSFSANELRVKVTSKGGTTQAALDVFAARRFDQTVKDALFAAKKRAKELSK